MPCDLTATKLAACESGIGKLDNPISLLQIIAQLACEIADAGGGGGSQFISGAGAPAAGPTNPDAPAQYFDTTNDFTYNWNLGTQSWVPVPKVYRVILFQSGVIAPVVTVLENTLGGNPSWAYTAVGIYTLTLAGAFPFATTGLNINAFTNLGNCVALSNEDGDSLEVRSNSGGVQQDDILYNTFFEVLVYP